MPFTCSDICKILFAVIFPPLGVFLEKGCECELLIAIALTCLGYIPVMPFTCSDICKIIFAIFLPPLGVLLEKGCDCDLLINILLTCLGYIPGIIHALYIIFKY
ncbi:unnamed protein product [Medioppia subpectinata]|uniref:Plasma membrane proteolipid 3 n=1 Tax=Medioppia subpectinata TaxID=1979941 RepID=A0A7R9PTP9_9ACAR|nr:unnamed protein product [Medioppia subpectinata]CAG2100671.1 unnamed protein product [Medioppia subpectinata]